MTITRGITAAACCAGLALAPASTASADPPVLSGHYVATMTAPNQVVTSDWQVGSCGDGCASVLADGTPPPLQAHLVSGQWTMDNNSSDVTCADGTVVANVLSSRYTWDAATLAGTVAMTWNKAACGRAAGLRQTDGLQLRLA
jgi:hypothetical protein